MQAQCEFLKEFQELIDLLKLRENQSAELGNKSDVLSDQSQCFGESITLEEQSDCQPNQESNQNSQP